MLTPRKSSYSRSLEASVRDASAHAVMLGMGENYLSAFGIFLHGTPIQVGLVSSLPPLIGALAQNLGVLLMNYISSRRRFIASLAVVQASVWLLIGLLAWVGLPGAHAVTALILLASSYHSLSGIITPSWSSLMGDLVPPDRRGRFFGFRAKKAGLYTFLGIVCAGGALHLFEEQNRAWVGFLLIFGCAFLARIISAYWLTRHEDSPFTPPSLESFSFVDFIRRAPNSNFAKFVFFFASVNFGAALSGPYFAYYMLKVINLSYFDYTLIAAAMVMSQYLTLQRWGDLSDRFGNRKILMVCAFGVTINPFMWLVSNNTIFIIAVQLWGGAMWAGFNLAASNFMFDSVTPQKRARCVAYQSVVNGSAVCLASCIGGYITTHLHSPLPPIPWLPVPDSVLLFVFVLSGVARLVGISVFLPQFREVRPVEDIAGHHLIFRVAHVRPLSGVGLEMIQGVLRRKRKKRSSAGDSSSGD